MVQKKVSQWDAKKDIKKGTLLDVKKGPLLGPLSGRLICIDPSIRDLGWAEFFVDDEAKTYRLVRSGFLQNKTKDWLTAAEEMAFKVLEVVPPKPGDLWMIEQPKIFTSVRGQAAVDSVLKLFAFVAVLRLMVKARTIVCERLVFPHEWKGQTSKGITQRRIQRSLGVSVSNNNECDAIGIGDWWARKKLRHSAE